jgi:hypothetical protein
MASRFSSFKRDEYHTKDKSAMANQRAVLV